MLAGLGPAGDLGESPCLAYSSFWGYLHSLACGHLASVSASVVTSLSPTTPSDLLPLSGKGPGDYNRLTWVIEDNSPTLRFLV